MLGGKVSIGFGPKTVNRIPAVVRPLPVGRTPSGADRGQEQQQIGPLSE